MQIIIIISKPEKYDIAFIHWINLKLLGNKPSKRKINNHQWVSIGQFIGYIDLDCYQ